MKRDCYFCEAKAPSDDDMNGWVRARHKSSFISMNTARVVSRVDIHNVCPKCSKELTEDGHPDFKRLSIDEKISEIPW